MIKWLPQPKSDKLAHGIVFLSDLDQLVISLNCDLLKPGKPRWAPPAARRF